MNELDFRKWLANKGGKKKVQNDCIYRLKRIEREINHCDIDEQYHSDRCDYLLSLFDNNGKNELMDAYPNVQLPIGKYYMSTYRMALKKYIQFCDETIKK